MLPSFRESEDTALLLLKEIYSPLGFRPTMPGAEGGKSRDTSLPPRHTPTLPLTNNYQAPTSLYQPAPAFSPSTSNIQSPQAVPFITPPTQSNYGPSPPTQSSFGPPPPTQSNFGPPPPMFGSQGMSTYLSPGVRKSPYVPPDFSNLPTNQQAAPSLPPMGPAIAGGYRRAQT